MRLLLFTGKGGVGKTTTSAATAVGAAERGHRTLIISADAAHSLGDVLGERLGSEARELAPRLHAQEVDARAELARHWGRIHEYLVSLFRYQGIEEVVAEELALLPGAEEVAALLAVEEAARSRRYDLVVVDCAPTDTTLRLLTLPDVAHGALRLLLRVQRALSSVVTPLARSVLPVPLPDSGVFRDLEKLLYQRLEGLRKRTLSEHTSVRMVVTPERMVIDEARRAFTELSLFELTCDAVVMNRLLPEAATREEFFRDWDASRKSVAARSRKPLRRCRSCGRRCRKTRSSVFPSCSTTVLRSTASPILPRCSRRARACASRGTQVATGFTSRFRARVRPSSTSQSSKTISSCVWVRAVARSSSRRAWRSNTCAKRASREAS